MILRSIFLNNNDDDDDYDDDIVNIREFEFKARTEKSVNQFFSRIDWHRDHRNDDNRDYEMKIKKIEGEEILIRAKQSTKNNKSTNKYEIQGNDSFKTKFRREGGIDSAYTTILDQIDQRRKNGQSVLFFFQTIDSEDKNEFSLSFANPFSMFTAFATAICILKKFKKKVETKID